MKNTPEFLYKHGDINYDILLPCFTKTRPINNKTNIIILLDYNRHWGKVFKISKIDKPFYKKKILQFGEDYDRKH